MFSFLRLHHIAIGDTLKD